jgi:hypothetical protein
MDFGPLSTMSPAKRGFGVEVSATSPDLISRPDEDQAGQCIVRTSGHAPADGSARAAETRPASTPALLPRLGSDAPQMRPWRIA